MPVADWLRQAEQERNIQHLPTGAIQAVVTGSTAADGQSGE
jgi:hypothetical protein